MFNLDFKELEDQYTALFGAINKCTKEVKKFQSVYNYKVKYFKYDFPRTKLLQSKSKCPRIVRVVVK